MRVLRSALFLEGGANRKLLMHLVYSAMFGWLERRRKANIGSCKRKQYTRTRRAPRPLAHCVPVLKKWLAVSVKKTGKTTEVCQHVCVCVCVCGCICVCEWVDSVSTQGIPDRQTDRQTDGLRVTCHTTLIPMTPFAVILSVVTQTVRWLHGVTAAAVQLKLHYHALERTTDRLLSFLCQSPGEPASPAGQQRTGLGLRCPETW